MARIEQQSDGHLTLSGVLDYRSGVALRAQGKQLITQQVVQHLVLSCAEVEKSSSVGLSLLLAFKRDAQLLGKTLRIENLPSDMQKIAQVSELQEILMG